MKILSHLCINISDKRDYFQEQSVLKRESADIAENVRELVSKFKIERETTGIAIRIFTLHVKTCDCFTE